MDFNGHGYSDDERVLVKNYVHLFEDVLCLLIDIFINGSLTGVSMYKIPFYIMGHSMGGSIAILTSLLLDKSNIFKYENYSSEFYNKNKDFIQKNISPYFKGCILIFPSINVNFSNIPFLKRCISSLPLNVVSNYSIPKYILDENRYNYLSWSCPIYLKYIEDDG